MTKKETIIIAISTIFLLILTNFMTYFYLNYKFNSKLKYQKYRTIEAVKYLEKSNITINCGKIRDYLDLYDFNCNGK